MILGLVIDPQATGSFKIGVPQIELYTLRVTMKRYRLYGMLLFQQGWFGLER